MPRHLKPNIIDIAAEICRRDTETPAQVDSNRMKLIYGLAWCDTRSTLISGRAWTLMKSFLTHEEKKHGIALARELIDRIGETKP